MDSNVVTDLTDKLRSQGKTKETQIYSHLTISRSEPLCVDLLDFFSKTKYANSKAKVWSGDLFPIPRFSTRRFLVRE
jgi:hypothetical protein